VDLGAVGGEVGVDRREAPGVGGILDDPNSVLTGGTYPPSGTGSAVPATDVPVAVIVPNLVALAMWKVRVPLDPATSLAPPLRV